MITQELEVSLHKAFMEARDKRHEFISVEHLLLALLDNPSASILLRECSANLDELRKLLTDLVEEVTPRMKDGEIDTQPTLGFQRVIQQAILHVQTSGKKEVTSVDVLVAIFGEQDSAAVRFLEQAGVSRFSVVTQVSHGKNESVVKSTVAAGGHNVRINETVNPATAAFKVVLLNDDYTPMDFVVGVLHNVFAYTHEQAMELMLEVHREGVGVCGPYTLDDAVNKVERVREYAKGRQHPLQCLVVRCTPGGN
jgi:ATP-dependent Clp protease adapter protein ClpS